MLMLVLLLESPVLPRSSPGPPSAHPPVLPRPIGVGVGVGVGVRVGVDVNVDVGVAVGVPGPFVEFC